MSTQYEPARSPEELSRLVVERVNAGDAAGVAALYEPRAVVGFPSDNPTVGREAIQSLYQKIIDHGGKFEVEDPLPTLYFEDVALTATRSKDGTGGRSQVLRRQPDGTWLRILDRPEAGN
ncbi:MAG: YybH family protein [Stackebrandtia sp.]